MEVGRVSPRDAECREGLADLARGGELGDSSGAKAVGVTRPGYLLLSRRLGMQNGWPAEVLLLAVELWEAVGTASNTPASTARIAVANKRLPFTPITTL